MGFVKNIFSGLVGIIVFILKLPITLISLPLKLLPFGKAKEAGDAVKAKAQDAVKAPDAKKKSDGAFYLEADDAKGFSDSAPKAATPAKAPAAKEKAPAAKAPAAKASAPANNNASANALNLPQPTVTTSDAKAEPAYSQFGPRRTPGANMKSFLDMAKTVKRA